MTTLRDAVEALPESNLPFVGGWTPLAGAVDRAAVLALIDAHEAECGLGAAWAEAEAALPDDRWTLMAGRTNDCRFCHGYWATASWSATDDERASGQPPLRIVSSETGRPRGEHHDATPTEALRALATVLRESRP